MYLLANVLAENSSRNALKDYTEIFDELFKGIKIDTFIYMMFLKEILFLQRLAVRTYI